MIPKRRSHLGQQPSVHLSNQPGTFDFAPINTNIKLAIVPIERHISCHFNGGINITSATSPSVPPPSTIISNEDDLMSLPSQSSFPNYRVSSNIDPYESDSTSHLSTSPMVQALPIGKVCHSCQWPIPCKCSHSMNMSDIVSFNQINQVTNIESLSISQRLAKIRSPPPIGAGCESSISNHQSIVPMLCTPAFYAISSCPTATHPSSIITLQSACNVPRDVNCAICCKIFTAHSPQHLVCKCCSKYVTSNSNYFLDVKSLNYRSSWFEVDLSTISNY